MVVGKGGAKPLCILNCRLLSCERALPLHFYKPTLIDYNIEMQNKS